MIHSISPPFYIFIFEIFIKIGSERKNTWIDDDVCVDVNDLLEMEGVSSSSQHRIDERHSIFIGFCFWKHIDVIVLRKLRDFSIFRENHSSDIELSPIQRQHAQRKLQFL